MKQSPPPEPIDSSTPAPGPVRGQSRFPWALAGLLVVITIVAVALRSARTTHASNASPGAAATPGATEGATVGAAKIRRDTISRELVFDCELRPYQEVNLHAKVAGFVQNIYVDIGDPVKEGQLIATLEIPEAQSDLDRASASQRRAAEEIKRAEAAYQEAKVALGRLDSVIKMRPNLIAQQEIDVADAREKTAAANLAGAREQAIAAEADVQKLKTMLQYAQITAPFAGVITERYADKGALIQAGTSSSTQAMPLVRLSDNRRLRLVFPVSVSFVAGVRAGNPVRLQIPGQDKMVAARITRTSQKVLTATRTMDAEVDIDNADGTLIPGMYASVRLDVDARTNALVVPIEALSRGKSSSTVYVIDANNVIEERKVKLGVEAPDKVEVLEGVQEGETVMIGNRSQVKPGQKVVAKLLDRSAREMN